MIRSFDRRLAKFYLWLAVGYFVLALFSSVAMYADNFYTLLFNNLWGVVYVAVINFILFEYAVPVVLDKKRNVIINIMIGILLLLLFMLVYSYGSYLWRRLGIALHIYHPLKIFVTLDRLLQNQMAYSMGGIVFFGVIRHIYNYAKLKQATQALRIEKQAAELSFLKSQTNPHFLFNTLNNIYSLARDKNDLAPEAILRLSKILRFMLYDTAGAYIAIEQELKMITDYIALEKLRYDESLRIDLVHDIEDPAQALPPLLLIPLVENAFKHGVSESPEQAFVDIRLFVHKRQLFFIVKNSVDDISGQPIKENIGLSNLRRQLELLYTDYDLSVQQSDTVFTASLKINLSSHV